MFYSVAPTSKYASSESSEGQPTREVEGLKGRFTLSVFFFELFISVWVTLMLLFPKFLGTIADITFQHKLACFVLWGLVMLCFLMMFRTFRIILISQISGVSFHYLGNRYKWIPSKANPSHMFISFAAIATFIGILYLRL